MKRALLCLVVLSGFLNVFSQNPAFDADQLQSEIQNTVNLVYKSVVRIIPSDSATRRNTGGTFSGVVVSAEGHILSAAHAVTPGNWYLVYFPDGKSFLAKGLGRIPSNDAALLRITDKGNWPFADIGWSYSLKEKEPCISIAYPGSLELDSPTIRFGYIAEPLAKGGYIRSTCLMEPGDSGGPLFDLLGRVIGIRSRIEIGLESNYDIPVDLYRKYWSALNQADSYRELPQEDSIGTDPLSDRIYSIAGIENIPAGFKKAENRLKRNSVMLKSYFSGKESIILGTLFQIPEHSRNRKWKNNSFLVSKSSMVGDSAVVLDRWNIPVPVTALYRDEENDLVFLVLDHKTKGGIILNQVKDSLSFSETGKWLLSPRPGKEMEVSVLGNVNMKIAPVANVGFLGISSSSKDGQVVLTSVIRRSPAGRAQLKLGDEIISINNIDISGPADLSREIQKYKPQETITLLLRREGEEMEKKITLRSRLSMAPHVADQFTDGKSERRYGFKQVFVHDGKLKPSECGGPVFDNEGIFYGINIARISRTSSLAIPVFIIRQFIDEAITRL